MSGLPAGTMPPGRLAGIDYGRRRIGVAVCDAERILASPLRVHETSGDRAADERFFLALAAEESLAGFVIGLPVHADGTASEMSAEVERFGRWLSRVTRLPIVFQDERHTSREAAGLLAGVGLTRSRRKSRADAVAAQVILAAWMEMSRSGRPHRPPEPLD